MCQRYNLKANHNLREWANVLQIGVYQCVKDTIWKQITTASSVVHEYSEVFISVSKIQFESKSQLQDSYQRKFNWCLSVCQRYNLKANHNGLNLYTDFLKGVYQCVKDTIWKQITTYWKGVWCIRKVFISVSKIQFESKSQPKKNYYWFILWCLSVCQRYNLKANHNV